MMLFRLLIGILLTAPVAAAPPNGLGALLRFRASRISAVALVQNMREAYHHGVIEERLTFTVQTSDGASTQTATVRVNAGENPRVRLDLGDLILYLETLPPESNGSPDAPATPVTRLIGLRRADTLRYVEQRIDADLTAETLRRLIPPMPIPALALALGSDSDWDQILPFGAPVRWQTLDIDPETRFWRALGVVSRGGVETTPATIWVDPRDHHIRRVQAPWPGRESEADIRIDIAPLAPEPIERWRPDLAGRTAVDSWNDLASPPPPLVEGDTFPAAALSDLRNEPWSGASLVPPPGAREARYALLILYSADATGPELDMVHAGVQAMRTLESHFASRIAAGERPVVIRLGVIPVPVFKAESFSREALAGHVLRWQGAEGINPMLWSFAPAATLERAAPARGAAAVLVGSELMVLGVYPADEVPGSLARTIVKRAEQNAWPDWTPE